MKTERASDSFAEEVKKVCTHQLFERQVARTPDAVAAVSQGEALTYQELNARANQLARYLRQCGVRSESLVGLFLNRSPDLILSMLASLKAGAAFVPLDPQYPAHRLGLVFEDTSMPVLLSHSSLCSRLPLFQGRLFCMDELWEQCGELSRENLGIELEENNLAYVIYTSGSTGRPKGVAIEHKGLVNLVNWHIREYGISQTDRATQMASPGFDAAVWEIWPYLCAGASVHIVDDETRGSVWRLKEYVEREGITMSFLPTPLAEVMMEEGLEGSGEMRGMLTGGDRLRKRPKGRGGSKVYNHYGPTENTVVATGSEVEIESEGEGEPTIGRPISNVKVYVLDERHKAVAVGEKGELYIGGVGLARGYINDAEKTAESFIPNPLSGDAGGRMYKSGDVARYNGSAELEFIGRKDNQVKVRGYRIELGDIETALMQHASVRTAVVELKQSETGEGILIGYIVPNPLSALREEELKEHLRERLPEYMAPARFVIMENLPLTVNGKIDRCALPIPGKTAPEVAASFTAPRSIVEERLAGVWAASLGLDRVSIHDNFFEIGGDSIRSIQLISMASQIGLRITAKQLFQYQSIAKLAEVVETTDVMTDVMSHKESH